MRHVFRAEFRIFNVCFRCFRLEKKWPWGFILTDTWRVELDILLVKKPAKFCREKTGWQSKYWVKHSKIALFRTSRLYSGFLRGAWKVTSSVSSFVRTVYKRTSAYVQQQKRKVREFVCQDLRSVPSWFISFSTALLAQLVNQDLQVSNAHTMHDSDSASSQFTQNTCPILHPFSYWELIPDPWCQGDQSTRQFSPFCRLTGAVGQWPSVCYMARVFVW